VHEKIETRSVLFRGRYLLLERLNLSLDGRKAGIREIVRVPDAAAVLPLDRDKTVHLVRQFRPAVNRVLLEIPAGLISKGESAGETAARECEEETGVRPRRLRRLITYAHAEGYSTGFITLFLGTDLEYTGSVQLDASEHLYPVRLPFQELIHKVDSGEIVDSKTILSTLLTREITAD